MVATPVDDRVSLIRQPFSKTETITVTDTKTSYQYPTEVVTDVFTITHRAYDIQQQVITSTIVET